MLLCQLFQYSWLSRWPDRHDGWHGCACGGGSYERRGSYVFQLHLEGQWSVGRFLCWSGKLLDFHISRKIFSFRQRRNIHCWSLISDYFARSFCSTRAVPISLAAWPPMYQKCEAITSGLIWFGERGLIGEEKGWRGRKKRRREFMCALMDRMSKVGCGSSCRL